MTYSKVIMIFYAIFLCFFFVIFSNTKMESATNRANNVYAHYVASACEDAMELTGLREIAKMPSTSDKGILVWKNIKTREDAVNTFYSSYGLCLNKNDASYYHELEMMVPALFLVDTDGFYVAYHASSDTQAKTHVDDEHINNISPLHTWSEKVGEYIVRYYLSDKVQVMDSSGKIKEGYREDVCAAIGAHSLEYLMDPNAFEEAKNACIIQTINEQLCYYVNNINQHADTYDTQYTITLPETGGLTWCGLIDEPAICAFVQGNTYHIRNKRASVFCFGIYDLGKPLRYFITENKHGVPVYYCLEEKLSIGEIQYVENKYYYKGEELPYIYNSKEDCAKAGAYPGV